MFQFTTIITNLGRFFAYNGVKLYIVQTNLKKMLFFCKVTLFYENSNQDFNGIIMYIKKETIKFGTLFGLL